MLCRIARPSTSTWTACLPPASSVGHTTQTFLQSTLRIVGQKRSIQTLTEKILQQYAVGLPEGKLVRSGDYVSVQPAACLTHDNTWPCALKFMSMGATKIHDPKQLVTAIDHAVQDVSESNLKKLRQIREFAETHGIVHYPAGHGIGHQLMVQEGHSWPGSFAVASDSHATHYGGIGCLSTPLVRTDAAGIWATGRTWLRIPPVIRVNLTGKLPAGVTGKDVIVALCTLFPTDVHNLAVEFHGSEETMASLLVDDRLTICNMSCEWGVWSAIFATYDKTLEGWLRNKATDAVKSKGQATQERINHKRIDKLFANPPTGDSNAVFAKQLYLNLSTLSPYVSGPNSVKVATPLGELIPRNIKIDRAYILSCTNARSSDFAAAAKVFRNAAKANSGKIPRIADSVQLYIAAASLSEQKAAEDSGDWQVLLEAGAQELPPGCAACIGLGAGLLEDNEVGISSSNRNFVGRMGSRASQAYLSSPEVVAASALSGTISGTGVYKAPAGYSGVEFGYGTGQEQAAVNEVSGSVQQLDSSIEPEGTADGSSASGNLLPGFPEEISGEIIFLDKDNLDTDAIYPGKLTYQDNVTKEGMAEACMMNYDPDFNSVAKPSDIIVSGFNFGCGSSREQAATSILAKEIPLVVAGSFGNVFSRNSINNALLCLESTKLVERLRATFSDSSKVPTRRTGWTLTWNVKNSTLEVQEGEGGETWKEKVSEIPPTVQDIIAAGGLEAWVKREIQRRKS